MLAVLSVLVLAGCGGAEIQVSGTAPGERIEAYEAMAGVALGQVEDLWGEDAVARPVEVVLPGSAAEFAELTGGAPASQEAPAVTVGSLDEAHVVVHPDSWDRLTPEGRQAVLTHEVTHLSMQGDGGVPGWLGEGLAEYTAHRTSDLAPAAIAGSALDPVRAGQVPTDWPDLGSAPVAPGPVGAAGDGADEPAEGSTWGGYALAWLACLYLADTWSEEQLVELYEVVAGGSTLTDAVPQVLGVSEAEALAGWGEWLTTL